MAFRLTSLFMASSIIAAPVSASEPVARASGTVDVAKKPAEKMICEDIQELGSRLNFHRVCMTKSEWQAQRYSDRDLIDKSQKEVQTQPAG